MNVEGPDVLLMKSRSIRKSGQQFLKQGKLTSLNNSKLPQKKRHKGVVSTSGENGRVEKVMVPVVYVYREEGYTSVEYSLDDKGREKPVFSFPIGEKEGSESTR